MQVLTEILGSDVFYFFAWAIPTMILIVLSLAALAFVKLASKNVSIHAKANSPVKLSVIDVAPIDNKRSLVLIKRDQKHHLLMVGGPNDLLVESNIQIKRQKRTLETQSSPPFIADKSAKKTPQKTQTPFSIQEIVSAVSQQNAQPIDKAPTAKNLAKNQKPNIDATIAAIRATVPPLPSSTPVRPHRISQKPIQPNERAQIALRQKSPLQNITDNDEFEEAIKSAEALFDDQNHSAAPPIVAKNDDIEISIELEDLGDIEDILDDEETVTIKPVQSEPQRMHAKEIIAEQSAPAKKSEIETKTKAINKAFETIQNEPPKAQTNTPAVKKTVVTASPAKARNKTTLEEEMAKLLADLTTS